MTDTIAFGSNENNDLYLDANGNLAIVSNLNAVLQGCEQAVKTQLGELVLQTTLGVPYFDAVYTGVPNINAFNAAIRSAITSIPGVVQVVSLDIEQNGDVLNYTAQIETEYGAGAING